MVASFIGLPNQEGKVRLQGDLIGAFQYLQREYQEKTGIGSTQQCMVGR